MKTKLTKTATAAMMAFAFVGQSFTGSGESVVLEDTVPISGTAEIAVETTSRIIEAWRPVVVVSRRQAVSVKHDQFVARSHMADESVYQFVLSYFSDVPDLVSVARCESSFRQWDDSGQVLRGHAVSADVGVMQINEVYHLADSRRLGYDIHTLEGNTAYARFLYERQGLRPWGASKPCWSNYN